PLSRTRSTPNLHLSTSWSGRFPHLIDDEAFQIASASCSIQLDLGKRSRLEGFDLCHLGYFFGSTPLANTATEASPSVFSLVLVDQIARANGQSAREGPHDSYR